MRGAPTPAAGRGRARATEGPERQVDSRGGRGLTGRSTRSRGGAPCGRGSWIHRAVVHTLCLRMFCSQEEGRKSCVLTGKTKLGAGCPALPAALNLPRAERELQTLGLTRGVYISVGPSIFCLAHRVWWPFLSTPSCRVRSQPGCYPPLGYVRNHGAFISLYLDARIPAGEANFIHS